MHGKQTSSVAGLTIQLAPLGFRAVGLGVPQFSVAGLGSTYIYIDRYIHRAAALPPQQRRSSSRGGGTGECNIHGFFAISSR